MHKKKRLELAQWAMERAIKSGANEAAVSINSSRSIEIEFRDKRLDKVKESTQNSLNVQIYIQKRYSAQSTNDLRRDSLDKFITDAVAATKYLSPDEYRSLPDPKYYPAKEEADLKILDNSYERITSAERVKIAAEIEAAAAAQSNKIISTTAGYSDEHSEKVRMHSNGFRGEEEGTGFSAGVMVTVSGDNGSRPEDWSWSQARFHKDLPGAVKLGEDAAQRALRKIGQRKTESGKYDMIVENRTGSTLISMLQQPMTTRTLQQKNSYLEGMIGEKIASEKLTMIDDPTLEKGLASQIFDNEGLAGKRRVMIEKGVLQHFYVDNYYGRKLGMEPTGGSASNVVFECGRKSVSELTKGIKKGILVNGFIGGNSNTTTGDFSFGIVGLLIENGEIVKAVNEMNISGNGKEFWNQLVAMGNDPYPYSSCMTPSMVFEGVQFSGT
jgi:PmbA protein